MIAYAADSYFHLTLAKRAAITSTTCGSAVALIAARAASISAATPGVGPESAVSACSSGS
jgi:hypothetical protein